MRKFNVFLVLLALSGCQTVEQSADAKAEKTGPTTRAYFRCGFAFVGQSQGSREDPYYIAIAAKTSCAAERQAVIEVIEDTYNPEIWRRLISSLDRTFTEGVISAVVKMRS